MNGFYASDQLKVTIERGALAMICARAPNLFKRKDTCTFTDLGPQNAQSYRRAKAANHPQIWMAKFRKPSIRAILRYKIAHFRHQKTVYLISNLQTLLTSPPRIPNVAPIIGDRDATFGGRKCGSDSAHGSVTIAIKTPMRPRISPRAFLFATPHKTPPRIAAKV